MMMQRNTFVKSINLIIFQQLYANVESKNKYTLYMYKYFILYIYIYIYIYVYMYI